MGQLRAALDAAKLSAGVDHSRRGQHDQAVKCLEDVGDLSGLDAKSKECVKTSYYCHAKLLQCRRQFGEALECFRRARQLDPSDILLLERTRLVEQYRQYRTPVNIASFRKSFCLGFTSSGFDSMPYPFLEMGKQNHVLQKPKQPAKASSVSDIYTLGVYRRQNQGRHLLSQKIREYKKENGDRGLAMPFAWLIADFIWSQTELIEHIDLVVPSPSNPNKWVGRGFVPALLIARELSKCLAVPFRELFFVKPMDFRFREISYEEGRQLITLREEKCRRILAGRAALLVDDVVTTGRTLALFADLLRQNGAKDVHAFALAKTGPAATDGEETRLVGEGET